MQEFEGTAMTLAEVGERDLRWSEEWTREESAAPHPLSTALDHASLIASRLLSPVYDGQAGSTETVVVCRPES